MIKFSNDLVQEIKRATDKFPHNRHLTVALMEEVGELSKALLENEGPARIREEAIHVACVAARIAIENDGDFDTPRAITVDNGKEYHTTGGVPS
jgi:NTP pyrophosphatase (non-canonical NTP hydrolase)